jgi:hypothetical protein
LLRQERPRFSLPAPGGGHADDPDPPFFDRALMPLDRCFAREP